MDPRRNVFHDGDRSCLLLKNISRTRDDFMLRWCFSTVDDSIDEFIFSERNDHFCVQHHPFIYKHVNYVILIRSYRTSFRPLDLYHSEIVSDASFPLPIMCSLFATVTLLAIGNLFGNEQPANTQHVKHGVHTDVDEHPGFAESNNSSLDYFVMHGVHTGVEERTPRVYKLYNRQANCQKSVLKLGRRKSTMGRPILGTSCRIVSGNGSE
jgi:hypothetical protein